MSLSVILCAALICLVSVQEAKAGVALTYNDASTEADPGPALLEGFKEDIMRIHEDAEGDSSPATGGDTEGTETNPDGVTIKFVERVKNFVWWDNDCCCQTYYYYWRPYYFIQGSSVYYVARFLPYYQWVQVGRCVKPYQPCTPWQHLVFSKATQCIQEWDWKVFLVYTYNNGIKTYHYRYMRIPNYCSCHCRTC